MLMEPTEKGYAVVRSFEGRALKAYRDAVGVWTIGFGITNADKWAVAYLGRPIGAGMTITEEQAEYLLKESFRRTYAPEVNRAMPNARPQDFDAGGSFHFNTGAIARASWVRFWKAKDFASMTPSLLSWSKAGGKVLAGLERRRKRENAIIVSGDYGPEGATKPPVLNANGRVVAADSADHHLAGTPGMLRRGDKGPEVTELQESLKLIGFTVDVDGDFGPATEKAVRAVQRAHPQLTEDGVVGPATRSTIKRAADAKRNLTVATASTVTPSGGVVAVDQLTGGHMPIALYVVLGVVIIAAVGWIAWKYRDELRTLAGK